MFRLLSAVIAGFLLTLSPGGAQGSDVQPGAVRIFTHGQGDFARMQPSGSFEGQGVDLLRCSMKALGKPYLLRQATMARKPRLAQQQLMDAWLPSIVHGTESRIARMAYPIGTMSLYWYVRKDLPTAPEADTFKAEMQVSAFPGSTPERLLRQDGYNVVAGTDDENAVILWLAEGKIDGFLAAAFDGLLKPGASKMREEKIKRTLFKEFDVGIEFTQSFVAEKPAFLLRFQKALTACL